MNFSRNIRKSLLLVVSSLLLVSLSFSSCAKAKEEQGDDEEEETSEVEHNVIKEYVNTPKDKAKGVASSVESKQDEQAEQAKKIAGE